MQLVDAASIASIEKGPQFVYFVRTFRQSVGHLSFFISSQT